MPTPSSSIPFLSFSSILHPSERSPETLVDYDVIGKEHIKS
ncbi:hypothetical protein CAEBREN_28343 [Caenorhabditis brenneri]|uniref:Uncharacterized protein n=1 Tax=Caenorhabditis brenneri TaxID=135651 RepID=G0MPV6_CAEBE|nr:hypothetical protein CAEBREN_28343 [Caenorhabditis brenneri]